MTVMLIARLICDCEECGSEYDSDRSACECGGDGDDGSVQRLHCSAYGRPQPGLEHAQPAIPEAAHWGVSLLQSAFAAPCRRVSTFHIEPCSV